MGLYWIENEIGLGLDLMEYYNPDKNKMIPYL
jgi:hypothetical protein